MEEAEPRAAALSVATVTSATLLEGLKNPENEQAWQRYVDRYRPLVIRFVRSLGFPTEDAEDVAQASLMAFSSAYLEGKYDRTRGRLRSWLFGIVHMKIRDHNRRRRDREVQAADTRAEEAIFGSLEEAEELEMRWETEWRDTVLQACLDEVRKEIQDSTWRAFELFTREGRSAEKVASELGISTNAVYLAKRRVLQRLREIRPLLEDIW